MRFKKSARRNSTTCYEMSKCPMPVLSKSMLVWNQFILLASSDAKFNEIKRVRVGDSARRVRTSPKTSSPSPSPANLFESEPESESIFFESESRIFLRVRGRVRTSPSPIFVKVKKIPF